MAIPDLLKTLNQYRFLKGSLRRGLLEKKNTFLRYRIASLTHTRLSVEQELQMALQASYNIYLIRYQIYPSEIAHRYAKEVLGLSFGYTWWWRYCLWKLEDRNWSLNLHPAACLEHMREMDQKYSDLYPESRIH